MYNGCMLWLERKYLSMCVSSLELAKWKGDTTLNHRCLYCGDSSKNKHKARGYHFAIEQSFIFKCHNCGKSTSSVNFLKDHFPVLHKEYIKEWLTESGRKPKKHASNHKMPSSNEFKFTPKTELLNMIKVDLSAIMFPAKEKIVAREYLQARKVPDNKIDDLWFVESAQTLSLLSPKYKDRVLGNDPRIVLPFFREDGELVGISGRAINDSPLRYLTMRFLDDDPLIYNIQNVDKTKTIYVTEGPIDSLFLPNSIAVGGSDFKKIDDGIKPNAVIIYDNEPRNGEILKKLEEVIELGYSVCIWDDKSVADCKDINDMIMKGMTQSEIIGIINACTFEGLSAKLKLMEYKKI
jgi:hypothetical protein